MLGRFMPREGKFFELFNAHAQQIVLGARTLDAMMRALYDSPEKVREYADEIDVIEDRADKITHQTVALLHSTFITPLDRDEINRLIRSAERRVGKACVSRCRSRGWPVK